MKQPSLSVIRELANKKRELLQKILTYSQRYNIETNEPKGEELLALRKEVFSQLNKNDQAIRSWEKRTGLEAKSTVPDVFIDLSFLMHSIHENNQAKIGSLETERDLLNQEKANLERGNKISGYFRPRSRNTSVGTVTPGRSGRKITYLS